MTKSFRHKGLKLLYEDGDARKIPSELVNRVSRRLASLAGATKPEDVNLPGYNFHGLQGEPKRYSVHVNGPWCITFGWEDDGAVDVDLENYH
jgi:proteic killer suppression protein